LWEIFPHIIPERGVLKFQPNFTGMKKLSKIIETQGIDEKSKKSCIDRGCVIISGSWVDDNFTDILTSIKDS